MRCLGHGTNRGATALASVASERTANFMLVGLVCILVVTGLTAADESRAGGAKFIKTLVTRHRGDLDRGDVERLPSWEGPL